MNDYEVTLWRNQYQENAYYYRGKIIDTFNNLEKIIENYLMKYFNPNDQDEFQSIILDRLTFEAKRTAFRAILEKQAINSGFIKTRSNSYPYSKLLEEIRLLNDQRNCFAHYFLIVPLQPDDSIICLAEFRDSVTFKTYTIDEYRNVVYRMSKALTTVNSMRIKLIT